MAELVAISDHVRTMRYSQFIKEMTPMMPACSTWPATEAMLGQNVFDYIEMFYNPTRKHTKNGMFAACPRSADHHQPVLTLLRGSTRARSSKPISYLLALIAF